MIFVFKRKIENNINTFITWFKSELLSNCKFRVIYSVLLKDPSVLIKQWAISLERRQYFRDQVQKQKEFLTRDVPTLIDGSRPERDID